MTKVSPLMRAIADMEGFNIRGSVPQRLNNPGDLMFVKQKGAKPVTITGVDKKQRTYAQFPTVDAGWAALAFQLSLYAKRGYTLLQAIRKWAPKEDGNDPNGYASYVAKLLNVPLNTQLSRLV